MSVVLTAVLLSAQGAGVWAAEDPASPPEGVAPAATSWLQLGAAIAERARASGIAVQMDEEKGTVRLYVQVATAFEGNTRELTPTFADFLSRVAMLVQDAPDSRVTIVGYGDHPAARYNPVLLGLRVRRVRTKLATEGVPFRQIKAVVKSHEQYAGPDELSGLAPIGALIELRFNPR